MSQPPARLADYASTQPSDATDAVVQPHRAPSTMNPSVRPASGDTHANTVTLTADSTHHPLPHTRDETTQPPSPHHTPIRASSHARSRSPPPSTRHYRVTHDRHPMAALTHTLVYSAAAATPTESPHSFPPSPLHLPHHSHTPGEHDRVQLSAHPGAASLVAHAAGLPAPDDAAAVCARLSDTASGGAGARIRRDEINDYDDDEPVVPMGVVTRTTDSEAAAVVGDLANLQASPRTHRPPLTRALRGDGRMRAMRNAYGPARTASLVRDSESVKEDDEEGKVKEKDDESSVLSGAHSAHPHEKGKAESAIAPSHGHDSFDRHRHAVHRGRDDGGSGGYADRPGGSSYASGRTRPSSSTGFSHLRQPMRHTHTQHAYHSSTHSRHSPHHRPNNNRHRHGRSDHYYSPRTHISGGSVSAVLSDEAEHNNDGDNSSVARAREAGGRRSRSRHSRSGYAASSDAGTASSTERASRAVRTPRRRHRRAEAYRRRGHDVSPQRRAWRRDGRAMGRRVSRANSHSGGSPRSSRSHSRISSGSSRSLSRPSSRMRFRSAMSAVYGSRESGMRVGSFHRGYHDYRSHTARSSSDSSSSDSSSSSSSSSSRRRHGTDGWHSAASESEDAAAAAALRLRERRTTAQDDAAESADEAGAFARYSRGEIADPRRTAAGGLTLPLASSNDDVEETKDNEVEADGEAGSSESRAAGGLDASGSAIQVHMNKSNSSAVVTPVPTASQGMHHHNFVMKETSEEERTDEEEEDRVGESERRHAQRMNFSILADPRVEIIALITRSPTGSVTLQEIQNHFAWDHDYVRSYGTVLEYLQSYQAIFVVSPVNDRVTLRRVHFDPSPPSHLEHHRTAAGTHGSSGHHAHTFHSHLEGEGEDEEDEDEDRRRVRRTASEDDDEEGARRSVGGHDMHDDAVRYPHDGDDDEDEDDGTETDRAEADAYTRLLPRRTRHRRHADAEEEEGKDGVAGRLPLVPVREDALALRGPRRVRRRGVGGRHADDGHGRRPHAESRSRRPHSPVHHYGRRVRSGSHSRGGPPSRRDRRASAASRSRSRHRRYRRTAEADGAKDGALGQAVAAALQIGSISCSCVSDGFDLAELFTIYRRRGYEVLLQYGVLHVTCPGVFDLFLFEHGVVVWWGMNRTHHWMVEDDFLFRTSYVRAAVRERYAQKEIDALFPNWCSYEEDAGYGEDNAVMDSSSPMGYRLEVVEEALQRFEKVLCYDHYLIPQREPARSQVMLTLSHSLGRSARADYLEYITQWSHRHVLSIPAELSGVVDYFRTKKRIVRLEGELQTALLGITSLKDMPDVLWEMPWLEPYFELAEEQNSSERRLLWFSARCDALLRQLSDLKSRRYLLFLLASDVFLIVLLIIDVLCLSARLVMNMYFQHN